MAAARAELEPKLAAAMMAREAKAETLEVDRDPETGVRLVARETLDDGTIRVRRIKTDGHGRVVGIESVTG